MIADIVSGEGSLADTWFLIATIAAGASFIVALTSTRDLITMLGSLAITFLALGFLFL